MIKSVNLDEQRDQDLIERIDGLGRREFSSVARQALRAWFAQSVTLEDLDAKLDQILAGGVQVTGHAQEDGPDLGGWE